MTPVARALQEIDAQMHAEEAEAHAIPEDHDKQKVQDLRECGDDHGR
jgi:hypothetical protein